jgi:predicted RNase H-like nuclease (RuvC/YqgF family)
MKAILHIVAIVAALGAAVLTFNHSNKFKELETKRAEVSESIKLTNADADGKDADIKKGRAISAALKEKAALLEQSISSLKSTGSALTSDLDKFKDELKAQDDEFAQLKKLLEEVNGILSGLGENITLEALPEKIQQIEDDKKAKQTKLEELEVLIAGTEKSMVAGREEADRLTKRMVERTSRISRNAMEAVVTAVNQDWGFLVIGAGSNSGFTPQTPLLVKRDGRMIAQVTPSSIEPTQTIAEIDLDSLASGVRLQPGDRVILAKPATN